MTRYKIDRVSEPYEEIQPCEEATRTPVTYQLWYRYKTIEEAHADRDRKNLLRIENPKQNGRGVYTESPDHIWIIESDEPDFIEQFARKHGCLIIDTDVRYSPDDEIAFGIRIYDGWAE